MLKFKLHVIVIACLLSICVAACGNSQPVTTTTEAVPTVNANDVEASFNYEAQIFGDKVADKNGGVVEVDKVRCVNVVSGNATCYVDFTVSDGYYEQSSSAAWNVKYDEQTAKIISYVPLNSNIGVGS